MTLAFECSSKCYNESTQAVKRGGWGSGPRDQQLTYTAALLFPHDWEQIKTSLPQFPAP